MLMEFRVENFRSLRSEQAITWETAPLGDANDPRPREVAGSSKPFLPVMALYGANASGKSNVLAALAFMRECVLDSHNRWEPGAGIRRNAFAWGEHRNAPSLFEVTFLETGVKYNYGFSLNDAEVLEEWLYVWPHGKKVIWFERDGKTYKFGRQLDGPNETVQSITRPNSLFLSAAAQMNHKQLSSIYLWFRRIVECNVNNRMGGYPGSGAYEQLLPLDCLFMFDLEFLNPDIENPEKTILPLLQLADVGIVDIKEEVDASPQPGKRKRVIILLKHDSSAEDSWLELSEESHGTKTLFKLAAPLIRALGYGSLLLVDELEASLHPLLALKIIELFNNPQTNPHNAQLLFTTHDTNLLGTTLGDPVLRRDQIWFTQKDKSGATTLFPLTDFKPRNVENLERGYLQGRYGAIPFLGDFKHLPE